MVHRPPADLWRRRTRRAAELSPDHPEVKGLLDFAAALSELQEALFLHPVLTSWLSGERRSIKTLPLEDFREEFELFLEDVGQIGPGGMREGLGAISVDGGLDRARAFLVGDATAGQTPIDDFVARAFVEPFATRVASELVSPGDASDSHDPADRGTRRCPMCGHPPLLAVLVDEESRLGARRLQCSLCSSTWSYPRLTCVACGQDSADQLTQRRSDRWEHLWVDACLRCDTYTKTIDLRRAGTAVPAIDDLASAALDMWASKQGWRRVAKGILTP